MEAIIAAGLSGDRKGVYEPGFLAKLPLGGADTWTMQEVTRAFPRQEVIELWRKACAFALRELRRRQQPHQLLTCHLTLYSHRTGEFYSPVDYSVFAREGMVPDRVLSLIDDVFDMYSRLTAAGELYSDHGEIYTQRALKRVAREVPAHQRAQLELEARVSVMTQLLAWRRADLIAAESLAAQYRVAASDAGPSRTELAVVAVKQLDAAIAGWLEGRTTAAYLSHPISRPRREFAEGRFGGKKTWPRVVGQFNNLQAGLAKHNILAVMPTAIDELRITKGRGPLNRKAELDPRWLVPRQRTTLYRRPRGKAIEHTRILGVGSSLEKMVQSAILRVLEGSIREDIAFRDHLLVAHNQHLLVFRPLYKDGAFSDGVHDEIEHWELSARIHDDRRIAFLHLADDVLDLWNHLRSAYEYEGVGPEFRSLVDQVLEKKGWDPRQRDEILTPPRARTLGAGQFSRDLRMRILTSALSGPVESYLWGLLTDLKFLTELQGRTGIWILPGPKQLDSTLADIAAFMRGTTRGPGKGWRRQVEVALGGNLTTLGEALLFGFRP